MRKRLLALISASAIVALMFGGTPRAATAANFYDYYISQRGDGYDFNKSCAHPFSNDLQDAFDDASGSGSDVSIFLCAGTYVGQYTTYSESVTIVGQSAKSTVIDGDNTDGSGDRALGAYFECDGICAGDLTIRNLTIRNGYSDGDAGAVYADDFACYNSVLSGNYAETDGGAVYAEGTVTTNKCTYSGNYAEFDGGAIWASDSVTDTNGKYLDNYSEDDGGAVYIDDDYGDDASTFAGSTFTGNDASSGLGYGAHGGDSPNGGALFSYGVVNLNKATFTNNAAGNHGGAVFTYDTINVANSKFIGNFAEYMGGAIASTWWNSCSGDSAYITSSTFRSNTARVGGALSVAFTRTTYSTFSGNAELGSWGTTANIWAYYDVEQSHNKFQGPGGTGINVGTCAL